MRALYCLYYRKWKNHLLAAEKSFCKTFGWKCSNCPKCIFKTIEDER